MIKAYCDQCNREIVSPERDVSFFEIFKDDRPSTELKDKSNLKHLCKDCYDVYVDLHDSYLRKVEKLKALEVEDHNRIFGWIK